jgi:hypothetical protein
LEAKTPQNCFPVTAASGIQYLQVQLKELFPFPRCDYGHATEFIHLCIQALPNSLQQLPHHVERLVPEETIDSCFSRKEPIYLARDGGAIPGQASFGWFLQIGTAQIAKGKGPAYGDDPRLFYAKGYGMASALLYLRILTEHF